MPRLPTAEDYQLRTPRPARDVVNIRPDESGAGIQKIGQQLGQMVEEETRKLEDMEVQDALVNLSYKDTELALGERGYMQRKLPEFTDGTVLKEYPEQYQSAINEIAGKIKSTRAREAFMLRARDDMGRFNRNMIGHVSAKVEKAFEVSDASAVEAWKARLASQPSAQNLDQAIRDYQGIIARSQKKFLDSKHQTDFMNLTVAELAGTTVDALINADRLDEAKALLEQHGKLMGDKLPQRKNHIDAKEAYTTGSQLAKQAMTLPAGQRREYVRANTEGKPKQYDVADKLLNDLERGEKDNIRAVVGALTVTFEGKPTESERARIRATKEFQTLPPDVQAKLEGDMRAELERHADRNRMSAAERAAMEAGDPKRFARFSELINDPNLGTKPAGWAQGFVGEIGKELTNKLEAEHQRQRSGRQKYSIASELIKGHAPESLFAPARKAQLNAYLGLVESFTQDWLARNPGTPTLADETEILQKATKRYVLDLPWRPDKKALAYELKPMPEDFINAARAAARKARRSDPTYEQLLDSWAKQRDAYK